MTETERLYSHTILEPDETIHSEYNNQINFSNPNKEKPIIQIKSKTTDNTKLTIIATISLWIWGLSCMIIGYQIANWNNPEIGLVGMFFGFIILFISVLYPHFSKNE